MGLLSVGTPLEWKDAQKYSDHVRKHGIEVFPPTNRVLIVAILEYLEGCQGQGEGRSTVGR